MLVKHPLRYICCAEQANSTVTQIYFTSKGGSVPPGDLPPDLLGQPEEAHDEIRVDLTPFGMTYGDIITDVQPTYRRVRIGSIFIQNT